ncbi:MAG TPA: glycosyltransferase family 4 protein [Rhizomicrobium sp.]
MRLLLVTDAYPPEIRSSSHLMVELAEELRDRGHEVHVLTSWPQYNLDAAAQSLQFEESMQESGIHVIRVRTPAHHNVGFIRRGLAQLQMPFYFLAALKKHLAGRLDCAIVYTPPLPLALVGQRLRARGVRFVLNVQDIFPQNAIDLGVLSNPALIGFFHWMERRAYRGADAVTVHSQGNRDFVLGENPGIAGKLTVLHNWIDAGSHDRRAATRDFRGEWKLSDKFVLLFAGVIGPSQALHLVLDAARQLRDLPQMVFLFVGDGTEKAKLEERARAEGLDNVVFKPFVSREDYPDLVAACDVGLVCLSAMNKTPVVPGKILGYMAGGKPIAAFLNKESDGHAIIKDAQCGYSCVSNAPAEVEALLRRLHAERAQAPQMGARGASYVRRHFSKEALVGQLEALAKGV